MTTVAIQLSASGLSWAVLPDPLDFDGDNAAEARFTAWPRVRHPRRGLLPLDMEGRLLAYAIVGTILADAEASEVLLAVEPGVDGPRAGIVEAALDHADVHVDAVEPHPDGAAGLVREHAAALLDVSPRPPGP